MLKKILFSLAALLAIAIVVVATRPSAFTIERTAGIEAPADVVFALVDDLHRWPDWSPWDKLDPQQKKAFEGPETGKGSRFTWKGNDQVGEGRMTITDSRPNEEVTIALEFLAPHEMKSTVTFALEGEGTKTKIAWRMSGENGFFGKAFSMFMDMDAMVGKDFEEGLASLRVLAKAEWEKRVADEKAREQEKAAAEAALAEEAGSNDATADE